MDQRLFHLINREWAAPGLDVLMAVMSSFAFWMPILLAVALLVLWRGGVKARAAVLSIALIVAVSDGLVANTLKKITNRSRPYQSEEGVRVVKLRKVRPQLLALANPAVVKISKPESARTPGRSFPSGHVMNNFAAATALSCFYRRRGWLLFVPAGLVAYSRIYVGDHWPSDVLAAMILGTGVALLGCQFLNFLSRRAGPRWWPSLHVQHPNLFGEP